MAPRSTTNKAKAAGVGASSFLDLKAEIASKKKEIAENNAAGNKTVSVGRKPGKVSDFPSPHILLSFREGYAYACVWSVGVETDRMEPT